MDIEKLRTLVAMYKQDKISDYVIEREFSEFFGDLVIVRIERCAVSGSSYCMFAIPERLTEGLKMTLIIDKNAMCNIYSEDAFAIVCERMRNQIQKILTKYHEFYNENINSEIGMNKAIGFLLSLYGSYRTELIAGNADKLPDETELMKYIDLFSTEEANSEDIETLKIKGFLSNMILDFAKKYIKMSDVLKINIVKTDMEKPVFCMGQQEIIKHCTSTFGVRDHKEIPYNYLPKTNQ